MATKPKAVKKEKEIKPLVADLQEMLIDILADAEKFDTGNNSKGKKVRIGLQEIKKRIKDIRDAVTEVKNVRKGKK